MSDEELFAISSDVDAIDEDAEWCDDCSECDDTSCEDNPDYDEEEWEDD